MYTKTEDKILKEYNKLPDQPDLLEQYIEEHEQQKAPLKQGAEARIVWNNKHKKNKTPFSIVYLHGFRGSRSEGAPVHTKIAKSFGCNLYLSRLHGHGLIRAQKFDDLTPSNLIQSAIDAYKVGQKIGENVILMGTSTGGALALYLAGSSSLSLSIAGLVLYSPLVHIYGKYAPLLESTFGRVLLRLIPGRKYQLHGKKPFSSDQRHIWYHTCQLNGALALGKFVQKKIGPSLFQNVRCPAFIGYYYKNCREHDRMVSTAAIRKMADELGTDSSKIKLKNFPHANTHVICSSLLSNAVEDVISSTSRFLASHFPFDVRA